MAWRDACVRDSCVGAGCLLANRSILSCKAFAVLRPSFGRTALQCLRGSVSFYVQRPTSSPIMLTLTYKSGWLISAFGGICSGQGRATQRRAGPRKPQVDIVRSPLNSNRKWNVQHSAPRVAVVPRARSSHATEVTIDQASGRKTFESSPARHITKAR